MQSRTILPATPPYKAKTAFNSAEYAQQKSGRLSNVRPSFVTYGYGKPAPEAEKGQGQ